MPTYEYECAKCKKIFEVFQKMTDTPLKKCPTCRSSRIKRLIGAGSGIIFKGSGFYETDYKRKPQKTEKPETAQRTPDKPESKAEAKTVSKTADTPPKAGNNGKT